MKEIDSLFSLWKYMLICMGDFVPKGFLLLTNSALDDMITLLVQHLQMWNTFLDINQEVKDKVPFCYFQLQRSGIMNALFPVARGHIDSVWC